MQNSFEVQMHKTGKRKAYYNPKLQVKRRNEYPQRSDHASHSPPEKWHDPLQNKEDCYVIEEDPGEGYIHPLTSDEVVEHIEQLPMHLRRVVDFVHLSRMTMKKSLHPLYGMQWGTSMYLYPMNENLEEYFDKDPRHVDFSDGIKYGARIEQKTPTEWRVIWTQETIQDFYKNCVFMHELGHLHDTRNTSFKDREAYANWFADTYGYPKSEAYARRKKSEKVRKRHHKQ